MQILVLNGSPRPHGNTAAMVEAFRLGSSVPFKTDRRKTSQQIPIHS